MARYQDAIVTNALGQQLQPGEQLQHWAYGVKQPPIWLIILLICLAVLPGMIAVALMTKEYVIGLTSQRLIILQVSGGRAKVIVKWDYWRNQMPPAQTSTGALFTHIKIKDPRRPFVAKFHRMGMPNNRQHAMAIAAAVSSPQQLPPGGYAPPQGALPPGGYPQGALPPGGYPPPQGALPPGGYPQGALPPGGYPPSQGGYPPAQGGGYPPPQQQGYPPAQQQGYPPAQQQGYPPAQQQGYPPAQQQGYPPAQQQGYPPAQQQGYPPAQQQGYPPAQQQGYPPAQGGGYGGPQGGGQGGPQGGGQGGPQGGGQGGQGGR